MGVKTDVGEDQRNRIMEIIREFHREHKYMPSLAQISAATGMQRTAVIWHIAKLREQKRLKYEDGNMSRSLRLR